MPRLRSFADASPEVAGGRLSWCERDQVDRRYQRWPAPFGRSRLRVSDSFAGPDARSPEWEIPDVYPENCYSGRVRRRTCRSATLDRQGSILSRLLSVPPRVAILRGGRCSRYHRNDRHRTDPGSYWAPAPVLWRLLRATLLPAPGLLPAEVLCPTVQLRATLGLVTS
jgi:hypothetical protein